MNTTSSIAATLASLTEAQKRTSELTDQFNSQRTASLKAIPGELGFASPEEFIVAFNEANGVKSGRKARKSSKSSGPRKARVIITDGQRAQIVKFFKDGGSAPDAVTKYDISLATAQNIKGEAGMVAKRS